MIVLWIILGIWLGILPFWLLYWYKKSRKKLKPLSEVQLYHSIKHMPQHNWEQMNATGKAKWLIVDAEDRERTIDPSKLETAFFSIHDEYSEHTGVRETMDKWSDLMTMRLEARVDYANGDKKAINRINQYTTMIENLMSSSGDSDMIENRMMIEKAWGQPIDVEKKTVYEVITMIKILEKQAKPATPKEDGEEN